MIYRFGDCELDTKRLELRRQGEVQPVEPQVFELLRCLVQRPEEFVSKDEIFASVWNGRIVSDAALSSRVKAARAAIGDSGGEQRMIRTVHGRGFRFIAPVVRDAASAAADDAVPMSREAPRQEIHYCTAPDGVSIAYARSGEGSPIVKTANWLNHLEYDWQSPIWRHWIDALSERNLFLRYDERACGLSDWKVDNICFEAFVADLEAVVDSAGLDRFALLGISQGCGVSVAYAVRHPQRVSHLMLLGGYAQGWRARGDAHEIARREAMTTLIAEGWGQPNPAFRQIFTSMIIPRGRSEHVSWFNDMMKASASAENAVRLHEAFGRVDVMDLLPLVRAPTLVAHARNDAVAPFEQGKQLAARIPGARLLPLDSDNHLLMDDEPAWQVLVTEVRRFLAA
jgi:DNA-binding winged helix-turn-helix (wHTH) protein/pimeloyl-ACP methyl ester carboxylesterase